MLTAGFIISFGLFFLGRLLGSQGMQGVGLILFVLVCFLFR